MDDFGWMVHDGTYRAVIWPFRTREEAIAWRGEFCLSGFVVERMRKRADVRSDAPLRRLRRGPAARARRR
jgi:hypothetical protein